MRRLTSDDHGIATIFVVLMMPMLFMFGALVFDGGRGLVAKRQAQNAADAGALAKATDCALSDTTTDFEPYENDGASLANAPLCSSGETTVSMAKDVSYVFWPGGDGATVTRSAIARWGTLGSASTVPLVISSCEFQVAMLDGTTDIILYLDDPKFQSGCSSLPGGFSQLDSPGCTVAVTAGGIAEGSPGADLQKVIPCITNPSAPALPRDILIAMYDSTACRSGECRGNGEYPVLGFAMFRVTGYSFNGNKFAGALGNKCPNDKTRGSYCIRGDFIRFVAAQGTPGPSTNFGTLLVHLSS